MSFKSIGSRQLRLLTSFLIVAGCLAVLVAGGFAPPVKVVSAEVAPAVCPGNICTGEISVGGTQVRYAYTQHVNPNGEFKIRLDGGNYDTGSLISFIIFDLPPFASWSKYAGPGSIFLPEEDVNPGRTAYERRSPNGCSGCDIDQVMSVQYSGLGQGRHTFNLFVLQNGGSASKNNLEFYVDAAAPSNGDESESLDLIGDLLTCADRWPAGPGGASIDNDLDYKPNCADDDCDGLQGDPIDDDLRCEIVEQTCYDEFDNDADGATDCQDVTCNGLIGRQPPIGPIAYCQYGNEYGTPLSLNGTSPCADYFDNDADGRDDCYDNLYTNTATGATTSYVLPATAAAQPQICWRHAAYDCPLTEISCVDELDNDIDIPYKDQEYPEAGVTAVPPTVPPAVGKDCRDYDCAGDPICPDQENHRWQTHDIDECQCFNGIDDDLDHLLDCKDPDCVGAFCEATGRICLDKEFDLGQRIQMCANEFDDDGDGPQDCADSDCKQKFGDCGPCPSREDFTYEACSDGKDNDVNGQEDCGDARCNGQFDGVKKLGNITDAAYCAAQGGGAEIDSGIYPNLCHDRLDNDGDGQIDCADQGCDGFPVSAGGPYCEMPAERSCDDGFDNDGNGRIDCLDPACHGLAACAAIDWDDDAACVTVPRMSTRRPFTANDPTVWTQSFATVHVNAAGGHDITDEVRIEGQDVYSSVTIVIGDNTDVNKVYPYASAAFCRLENTDPGGSGQEDFGMTVVENGAVSGGAIMIYNLSGKLPADFDVTVKCETPEQPALDKNYPVSISVLRLGDVPEYGEVQLQTRLYEATPPVVTAIEAEGEIAGLITVPYNRERRFRVIPQDPNTPPLFSSGICRCDLELTGFSPVFSSADGSCQIPATYKFIRDFQAGETPADLTLTASALDGAANVSADLSRSVTVNVTPVLTEQLAIRPPWPPPSGSSSPPVGSARPFFSKKDTSNKISVIGQFTTAENDQFTATCKLYIRNAAGAIVGGPGPIDVPNLNWGFGPLNIANCVGVDLPLPEPLLTPGVDTDGTYFATLLADDDDGDFAESNRRAMFMCDQIPGPGSDPNDGDVCHWADFDSDGAAEGFYTTLYSADAKACDNCVNLWNPTQADEDANGIGAECQSLLGRCEVDTDIVCGKHSYSWDDPDVPLTCPGGIKCCDDPADPECCPEPTAKTDDDDVPLQETQACRAPWGACSTGGEICFTPENCPKRGSCVEGENLLDPCNSDNDCLDADGAPVPDSCVGADLCLSLMYPWIQAPKGNVYSGRYIRAPEPPPPGRANATFCIAAKSGIATYTDPTEPDPEKQQKYVFTSEECGEPQIKPYSRFERPKSRNIYSTVLGRLDLGGLLAGKYGEVVEVADPESFVEDYLNGTHLAGRVYVVRGDLHVGSVPETPPLPQDVVTDEIMDAPTDALGAGTVLILGGNLYFWNNVVYNQNLPGGLTSLDRLASLGWIVLDETDPDNPGYGSRGNVYIGSTVSDLVGAFFIAGQGGIYTVAPPETDSTVPLTVRGLIVARQFHFSRSFKSQDQGSERVFYDGRAVVNPPPGFGDVTKTLPYFGDVAATP